MAKSTKYAWSKEILKPIFQKSKDREELEAQLQGFFEKQKQEGMLPKSTIWRNYFNSLQNFAKRNLLWKAHHYKERKAKGGGALTQEQREFLRVLVSRPTWKVSDICKLTKKDPKDVGRILREIKAYLERRNDYIVTVDSKTFSVSRRGFALTQAEEVRIGVSMDQYKSSHEIGTVPGPRYGDPQNFRYTLQLLSGEGFRRKAVNFISMVGDLVDGNMLLRSLKGTHKNDYETAYMFLVDQVAHELSLIIPIVRRPDGKPVKWYINTSPIRDRDIGTDIAVRLAEIRENDIIFIGDDNQQDLMLRGMLKNVSDGSEGTLLPLAPQQRRIPGQYASTGGQNQIRKAKRSNFASPSIAVIGGTGACWYKPGLLGGDSETHIVSLPGLHKHFERKTTEDAEREIGQRIIQVDEYGYLTVITQDFRNLIFREREFVRPPDGSNELQRRIIEALHKRPLSIGILESRLNVAREKVLHELKQLESTRRAGVVYHIPSRRWDFDRDWLSWKLRLPYPEWTDEDVSVAFGCMHALSTYPDGHAITDYEFLLKDVPQLILRHGAKILIGAGDFTQGAKVHGLNLRGEVFQGLAYDPQVLVAAWITSEIILEVFRKRFDEKVKNHKGKLTSGDIKQYLDDAHMLYVYCKGNHDDWASRDGWDVMFWYRQSLDKFLHDGIMRHMMGREIFVPGLPLIISDLCDHKVVRDWPDVKIRAHTHHGLNMKVVHPYTARTATYSIQPERLLDSHRSANVVYAANWHTGFTIERSEKSVGIRHVDQIPCCLHGTFFEDTKIKNVDTGVNLLHLRSKSGTVVEVESGVIGPSRDPQKSDFRRNNEQLEKILHDLNIDQYSSKYGK